MTDTPEFELQLGGGVRIVVPLANMRSALKAKGWMPVEAEKLDLVLEGLTNSGPAVERAGPTQQPAPEAIAAVAASLPTNADDETLVGRAVSEKIGPINRMDSDLDRTRVLLLQWEKASDFLHQFRAIGESPDRAAQRIVAERDAAIRERDEAIESEDALARAIDEAIPYVEGSVADEPHGPDSVARVHTLRRQRDAAIRERDDAFKWRDMLLDCEARYESMLDGEPESVAPASLTSRVGGMINRLRSERDELREKLAAWEPIVREWVLRHAAVVDAPDKNCPDCNLTRALKPKHRPDERERENP